MPRWWTSFHVFALTLGARNFPVTFAGGEKSRAEASSRNSLPQLGHVTSTDRVGSNSGGVSVASLQTGTRM